MQNIKTGKLIYDSIHGHIKLSEWAIKVIDSEEFQRLRELKQLGTCYLVFPSVVHTRFEHSVGVYKLASVMLESLKKNSNPKEIKNGLLKIPELKKFNGELTDELIELVKLAGLLHDVAHGPFSHLFQDIFLAQYNLDTPMKEHEIRAGIIIDHIIKKTKLPIDNDGIQFVKDLISPKKHQIGFIYQIVSNSLNSCDIDRFDYLIRDSYMLGIKIGFDYQWLLQEPIVCDDIICYPQQAVHELRSLFVTRYRLHKQYYSHKTVISTQYIVSDILTLLNKELKIVDSIGSVKEFCKMTDTNIMSYLTFVKSDNPDIIKAKKLLKHLKTRRLYRYIGSIVSDKEIPITIKDFIGPGVEESDVIVHKSTLGYVSGKRKNPINSLYFYNAKKGVTKCFKMDVHELTTHSKTFQEHVCMCFCRDAKKRKMLTELFEKVTEKYKKT